MALRTTARNGLILSVAMLSSIVAPAQTNPATAGPGTEQATVMQRLTKDGVRISREADRKWSHGLLTVIGFTIQYSEDPRSKLRVRTLSVRCDRISDISTPKGYPDQFFLQGERLKSAEKALDRDALFQGIKDACVSQEADYYKRVEEEERRAAILRDEEDKRSGERARLSEEERRLSETQHAADFREDILTAVRAAEEPDPFSSIRGEFDLSASDSHQWKTGFQFRSGASGSFAPSDPEKCVLLKTSLPAPESGLSWTLACVFTSPQGSYEGMVKSVQSALNRPYLPDETATVNQVFFADPTKPAQRLFVTRINEADVGVSVVAVRGTGVPSTVPNTAPFPAAPTVLPTEPTVRDEVEKIRGGRYAPMPPAQRTTLSVPAGSGQTTMSIKNSTAYELSVFFEGPVSKKLTLAPGQTQDLDLAPGTFHVAGRVAAANVLPFYGEEAYAGSARYSMTFYIAP